MRRITLFQVQTQINVPVIVFIVKFKSISHICAYFNDKKKEVMFDEII